MLCICDVESDTLFQLTKDYFRKNGQEKSQKRQKKLANTCRATYKSAKEQKKVNGAWKRCNRLFEAKKVEYGMLQRPSFQDYVKQALTSSLKQLSAERTTILKEKEKEAVKYKKFFGRIR